MVSRVLSIVLIVSCIGVYGKKTHLENLAKLRAASTYETSVDAYVKVIKGIIKKKPDSCLFYIKQLREFARETKKPLSNNIESRIKLYEGVAYYAKGLYPEGQNLINKSLKIPHNDSLDGNRYFYLALNHKKVGNYSESVEYYIKASKFFEETNDHYPRISILINLSNVLKQTNQDNKALDYLSEALKAAEEHGFQKLNRTIYTGMGNIFLKKKEYSIALDQFNESYNEARLQKSIDGQFYSLINIADAKRRLGAERQALEHLQTAVELLDTLNNRGMTSLAYYELGNFYAHVGNKVEAELFLGQALQIADSSKSQPQVKNIYKAYQILYENTKDYKKSLEYFKKFEIVKDTIVSRENSLMVARHNSQFELDRKDREIKLMAKENELRDSQLEFQESERERDRIFIYLLVGLGVLLLVLVLALAGISIIRSKKNEALKGKNEELEDKRIEIESQNYELEEVNYKLAGTNKALKSKNSEIESQKEELQAQRDLLNQTHEQLKERNKDVTDSIHYAQKIQQAMLNSSFHIDGTSVDYFTFYKPRDIVSGDYYWSNVVGDELIVAIGDCTGHGVPGAFMSCLGISLLNEIVFGRDITDPHTMLEELRNSVIQLIATDKNADLQIGDGMDIAIVCLNLKTNVIRFSGAMNGLSIVSENELEEIKGDKSPIGQHIIPNHRFTLIEKQLKSGDLIYMTTDGYKDQFGGPKGKKMGKRRLHEKLVSINELSIPVQKAEMIAFYKNWRKYEEQVDDVCLFGMKITVN